MKFGVWLAFVGLLVDGARVTIPLNNFHDVIYRGNVSVGNPPQTFEAVFHTGCTLTRFPARGCSATGRFPNACEDSVTYDPEASNSARPHIHPLFTVGEVQYTHFGASGRQYYDDLSFGTPNTQNHVSVKAATVGASKKVYAFGHPVVCLSTQSSSTNDPTFSDMYKAGVLTEPYMTVALRKCDQGQCSDGGAITFGDYDLKNCDSLISWVTAIPGSYMWRFKMETVTLNGGVIAENVIGNVDTGNSYIHVPKSRMATIVRSLNAQKQDEFYYTTACDSKFELVFKFNGRKFVVNEKHLLLNQQIKGQCVLALTENKENNDMFVLGSAFFRAVCVVHDIKNMRLGFGLTKPQ